MKFGKNLLRVAELSDPAWRPYWVDYKCLKKMIKQLQIDIPVFDKTQNKGDSTKEQPTEPIPLLRSPLEVAFFRFLHSELQKAIRFFGRIQEEYNSRVNRLQEGSEITAHSSTILADESWLFLARSAFYVYRDLLLLETYAIMTYCAFSKILKKHDKITGRSTRTAFMTSIVSKANFANTQRLQEMTRSSLEHYNEASVHLEGVGRSNLQEDERLFLSMISQLNSDVRIVADEEEAPMVGNRCPQISESPRKDVSIPQTQSIKRRKLSEMEDSARKKMKSS